MKYPEPGDFIDIEIKDPGCFFPHCMLLDINGPNISFTTKSGMDLCWPKSCIIATNLEKGYSNE